MYGRVRKSSLERSKRTGSKILAWGCRMKKWFCGLAILLFLCGPLSATSYYTDRLEDARAIYLTQENFPVHGDGIADDSEALQAAINKVQETTYQGIVFLPSGRYRVTKT